MVSKKLENKVVSTLAYYDVLNYPLTIFEVWKQLIISSDDAEEKIEVALFDIMETLELLKAKKIVQCGKGFYFLKGRGALVETRLFRDKISAGKLKRLRRFVWLLRFIPFVRMVAVTGRLAMKNAETGSDWDFLIALKSGKIWTGRTLVTAMFYFLGKWRQEGRIKDRACLNYFITDKSLEIRNQDMFSAHEYSFMLPVFGKTVFNKFQIKNRWIQRYKLHYSTAEILGCLLLTDTDASRFIRKLGERMLDFNFLESFLRRIEKQKIKSNPKTNYEGSFVEADDQALIFLPEPQGPRVFERFKDRLGKISA